MQKRCLYCNQLFEAKRSSALYCSAKHRTYAGRERERARKKLEALSLSLNGKAMLEQMRPILPDTAKGVEAFILSHGVECTEGAIKLCLTAYSEAQRRAG